MVQGGFFDPALPSSHLKFLPHGYPQLIRYMQDAARICDTPIREPGKRHHKPYPGAASPNSKNNQDCAACVTGLQYGPAIATARGDEMLEVTTEVQPELLESEDGSHMIVAFPWDCDQSLVDVALQQAKALGFVDIVSEGNMNGYTSQGCSDWDYYRLEPPLA